MSEKKEQHATAKPHRPVVKKMRWPFPLIWLVPIIALLIAGYYFREHLRESGLEITVVFADATGLKVGETMVNYRGVPVGKVSGIEINDAHHQVLVHVRLKRSAEWLATEGTRFWVVRPELSVGAISGLDTITSGPYIDTNPGNGAPAKNFSGLDKPPAAVGDGVNIVLHAPRGDHLSADSPVYYRGVEVGTIQSVQLSGDGAGVDVDVFVQHRYTPLVRLNSQFWIVSGFDVKGGLFSGVQMQLKSLRTLISGGVSFATPDAKADVAKNGDGFALYNEPKKEWPDWAPTIALLKEDATDIQPPASKEAAGGAR